MIYVARNIGHMVITEAKKGICAMLVYLGETSLLED
nr:MAG TPA: hypothetical protein [Caudoviricetes sp.]